MMSVAVHSLLVAGGLSCSLESAAAPLSYSARRLARGNLQPIAQAGNMTATTVSRPLFAGRKLSLLSPACPLTLSTIPGSPRTSLLYRPLLLTRLTRYCRVRMLHHAHYTRPVPCLSCRFPARLQSPHRGKTLRAPEDLRAAR